MYYVLRPALVRVCVLRPTLFGHLWPKLRDGTSPGGSGRGKGWGGGIRKADAERSAILLRKSQCRVFS